jgi:hypothetical protein
MLARAETIRSLKARVRWERKPHLGRLPENEERPMTMIANLDEFILEETDDGIFLTVTGDDDQTLKLKVTLDDLEEIVEVIDEVFGLEEDDTEEVDDRPG